KYVLIPGGFTNPFGCQNFLLLLSAEHGFVGFLGFFVWFLTPLFVGFLLFFVHIRALSGERSLSRTAQVCVLATGACYSRHAVMRWEVQLEVLSLYLSVVSTFLLHAFFEDNLNPASALFLFPMVCLMAVARWRCLLCLESLQ